MGKLNSRDEDIQKGPNFHGSSTYRPIELTEDYVIKHAGRSNMQELADAFCITRVTFEKHFGDVYRSAKIQRKLKRREQLDDVIDQLAQTSEYNHTHPDAKTNEFLKGMTLWMKRYDNLDAKELTPEDNAGEDNADPREIKVVRPTKDDM